jgi:hypothetical protein
VGDGPSPSGQWRSPAGPPQPGKKQWGRACLWGCAGGLAVAVVIVVVVLAIALGNRDESTMPAPGEATTKASPQEKTPETRGERADLLSFQSDDRSAVGITDVWVVWTIRNSSREKSDYSWDWEAVDADGTRVGNGTELETDVLPGQTARGESPTTLKTATGIKLNITSFDRTAGY